MRYEYKRNFTELLTNLNEAIQIVIKDKEFDGYLRDSVGGSVLKAYRVRSL